MSHPGGRRCTIVKLRDLSGVLLRVQNLLRVGESHLALRTRNRGLHRELDRQLEDRVLERQAVLGRIIEAEQSERKRIAYDLHDETIRLLGALSMQLGVVRRKAPGYLSKQLDYVSELAPCVSG